MVSTRILIEPVGLFSSMSLKQKYGVPECSTISSTTEYMGASWPHLKLESSSATRLGCRATYLAAHTLRLVFSLYEFFHTSVIDMGWGMSPASTSSPNRRQTMSSSIGSESCANTG